LIKKVVEEMCDSFQSLFGDVIYQYEIVPDCVLSENYDKILLVEKIYSFTFLLLFLGFFLLKRKFYGDEYFSQLKNDSIFVLLDDYYTIIYVKGDSCISEPFDELLNRHNYNVFDFFNLHKCCQIPCCNQFFTPIFRRIDRFFYPMRRFFWKHSKSFFFYVIVYGYIFFSPLEYLTSFLTAPCIDETKEVFSNPPLLIYGIIDLIISTCAIFVLTFMISFISSRRELQSFHQNDVKGKAYFFHYHIKKGMIFAWAGLLLKVMLMIISGHTFFDISLDAVSNLYWIGRSLFFLFMIRQSHSRKVIQRNCNCEYLKEESRFFQIQNFLYKNRVDVNKMMDFKKSKDVFMNYLSEKLDNHIFVKMLLFKRMMKVLEAQKFNNVIVKKNLDSRYHAFLATLFTFYFGVYVFLTILSTLTIIDTQNVSLKTSCFLHSASVGFTLMDFIEIICFPFLFYKTTRKVNLI